MQYYAIINGKPVETENGVFVNINDVGDYIVELTNTINEGSTIIAKQQSMIDELYELIDTYKSVTTTMKTLLSQTKGK